MKVRLETPGSEYPPAADGLFVGRRPGLASYAAYHYLLQHGRQANSGLHRPRLQRLGSRTSDSRRVKLHPVAFHIRATRTAFNLSIDRCVYLRTESIPCEGFGQHIHACVNQDALSVAQSAPVARSLSATVPDVSAETLAAAELLEALEVL